MKNDNAFSYFSADKSASDGYNNSPTTAASRCCRCFCSCLNKGLRVSPETYPFEHGYKKKGELTCVSDEVQKSCTVIHKFGALYIQLEGSYFGSTFGMFFMYPITNNRYCSAKGLLCERNVADHFAV